MGTKITGAVKVPAGGQGSLDMPINPVDVTVSNMTSGSQGVQASIVYVWIYPAVIAVTPVAATIQPSQSSTLQPPAAATDPSGNSFNVKTCLVYNNGPAEVEIQAFGG